MTPKDQARIEANIQNMRSKGATEDEVDSYVRSEIQSANSDPDEPAADLKPNDKLGFLNGGAQMFNNVLHYGSKAAQAVGIPASVVHATGSVLRDPLDVGNDVVRATGLNPHQANVFSPLPNQAQIDALNQQAANVGQRPGRLGVAAGQAVSAIPLAVGAAPLAPGAEAGLGARAAFSVGEGALNGGLNSQNPDDPLQVAGNAALGGLTAGALHIGGNAAAAALAPRFGPAISTLINNGQRVFTPARLMGSEAAEKLEDAARSSLLLGPLIKSAQDASKSDFNRSLMQNVVDRGGLTDANGAPLDIGDRVTQQTYSDVNDALGRNYTQQQNALNLGHDPQLTAATTQAVTRLRSLGANDQADYIENALDDINRPQYTPNAQNGPGSWAYGSIAGRDLKQFDQDLRTGIQGLRNPGQNNPVGMNANAVANTLQSVRDAVNDSVQRQAPDIAQQMSDTDAAYAQFKRMQEASTAPGSANSDPGEFNPNTYLAKTMQAAGSNQRATLGSQGAIPGQQVAQAGVNVLGNQVADSGTPFRLAAARLFDASQAGAAGLGPFTGGASAAGLAPTIAAGSLYAMSPVVSRMMTAQRPALFNALRQALDDQAAQSVGAATAGAAPANVFQGQPQ